jgi:hypothetical protein
MHTTRATLCALILLATAPTLASCDAIKALLEGGESSSAATPEACEQAAVCFKEINDDGGGHNKLSAKYEEIHGKKPGWPNTHKSWPARSEQECKAFMTFATSQLTQIKKDHPSFNQTRCGGK